MKNTYLLLHPSSCRYVKYIFDEIYLNNFIIEGVFRVDEWEKVTEQIYKNSFKKSKTVKKHVKAQAFINIKLFGECGLLVLLTKEKIAYDKLIKDTLELKAKIRRKLYEETNNKITIYVDLNKSVYVDKKNKGENTDKIFLSFLHCPDTIEQYEQDYIFLKENGLLQKGLSVNTIKKIIKYQSYLY